MPSEILKGLLLLNKVRRFVFRITITYIYF
uniref:Uncharacterized protein n=2 Tax=unclassified Caudoviricetes TaxID=2788787 RepID=A0A8S5VAS0_9CAUD|nr:MAG TPA: hypothetical protein [Siphoviridae sp. ctfrT39]DAG03857.1 MAG TPA: hypothetical protein [Siphoviridae sp. ct0vA12]DAH96957.1 MAG TPA: hypothetical protein [Caudoviricetes sp.]DAV21058.1 MAG TPA: hypothetical protein [Caudoviricetes sp.]